MSRTGGSLSAMVPSSDISCIVGMSFPGSSSRLLQPLQDELSVL